MKLREALFAAVAALAACGPSSAYVSYDQPPPPRREEAVQARAGFVWAHGHWMRDRGQWSWHRGHFEPERPGFVWVDGSWQNRGEGYVWVAGHWARPRAGIVEREHRRW